MVPEPVEAARGSADRERRSVRRDTREGMAKFRVRFQHRIAALSKAHQLVKSPNPCADTLVRELLGNAKRGARPRKQRALTKNPLQALLATRWSPLPLAQGAKTSCSVANVAASVFADTAPSFLAKRALSTVRT